MKNKDIAKALNISPSTVSKALNGAFDISDETRKMVLDYAYNNGYKTKDERIYTKKKRKLAFIFDNVTSLRQSNIFSFISMAFEKNAYKNNFEVINIHANDVTPSYDEFIEANNFDGAFICGLNKSSKLLRQIATTEVPTILYDNTIEGKKISTICSENIETIKELVIMLADTGATRIGFIHGDTDSQVANERFAGYIIGLHKAKLKFDDDLVIYGSFDEKSGREAAKKLLAANCDAIVASSDLIAIGVIRELTENQVQIPKQIQVAGYDDIDISSYITPSLTTVRQQFEQIGEKAFTMLLSLFNNRLPQHIIVKGEIIKRQSTK